MSRIFAYARISTSHQTIENQRKQIADAGYKVEPYRFIEETISGSTVALSRPGFSKLLNKIEPGDILIVTALDRLGRDAIDLHKTVNYFIEQGISLKILQLGDMDLSSSHGFLAVQHLAAYAEFERRLLVERIQAGLARAKAEGTKLGRREKTTTIQRATICNLYDNATSVSQLARDYNISRATILSIVRNPGNKEMSKNIN
jgi:putative DNA-invertase from lambdoid prophage Rac